MDNIKIEPNTREMRCEKCYRLHDLEWLLTNGKAAVGYRCFSHKKVARGFYYIKKFSAFNVRLSTSREISGTIREIKNGWYEVGPGLKDNATAIQSQFNFS